MSRLVIAVSMLLAALTMMMPSGVCPCWLNAAPEIYHLHVGDPEPEHDHDYLNQLSQTIAGVILYVLVPADVWIALTSSGGLFRKMPGAVFFSGGWIPNLDSPPPRILVFQ